MMRYIQLVGFTILVALFAIGCTSAPEPDPTDIPAPTSPPATDLPEPTDPPPEPTEPSPPTDTPIPPTETTPLPTSTPEPFTLTSAAFAPDESIPVRHACHGESLSPLLEWNEPPADTASLIMIMDDPDAIPVVGFVYDHWIIFNLPAAARELPEGMGRDPVFPDESMQGTNSNRRIGYDGPCPPSGQNHGYVFTLYAVDIRIELPSEAIKADVLAAIEGHILAQAELIGFYQSP